MSSSFLHLFNKMVGIIPLIGQQSPGLDVFDELMGKGDVMALARCAEQADGKPQRIAGGVDFGAQTPARPAKALGVRPPFCRRAPAAC